MNIVARSSLIALFIVFTLTSCQSAYYSAMEKIGTHKRDILIDRIDQTTDSQNEAKEEFVNALEQLSSLINFDGEELQQQFELSKEHYESSKQAADDISGKIAQIEHVAEALFDEWQDEIDQYSNQSFKSQSTTQLKQTTRRYQQVIKSMRAAEKRMTPILAALKDNMLYLKHNLNARAIGALKNEYNSIKTDVDRLIEDMNASIEQSQSFIRALKN